jgi:hypothetical protein
VPDRPQAGIEIKVRLADQLPLQLVCRKVTMSVWDRFTDVKDIKKEMLKRLEAHFEKWLNP